RGQLRERLGNELLAAEPGIDGHDQDEVQLPDDVIEMRERGRGIQHQARLAPVLADQAYRAVDMIGSFRVEGDDVRSRFREIRDDPIHRTDHEMHVYRRLDERAYRLADERADGEIGHVVVVHYVEMHQV